MRVAAVLLQWALVASWVTVVGGEQRGYYCYEDGHLHTNRACRFFAIVIDAGSTGTRMHVYRFVHSTAPHGLPFHVEHEEFFETKPALSSFVKNPPGAAESIRGLLESAKKVVPRELRSKTPIALKATAGLRLLPGDAAESILREASSAVHQSGFACIGECVGVLKGWEEGVHSWFTLNLLLENFNHDSRGHEVDPAPARSVAAFDLGGGSTQVTYWPRSESVFRNHPKDRRDIHFFHTHMHLYTHSYLGLGLQSARLGVLKMETIDKGASELRSACFPADFRLPEWEQSQKKWSIRGTSEYAYDKCAKRVRKFVRASGIAPLTGIEGESLYLFSYFFDRAEQAGLVEEGKGRATVRVGQFAEVARKACARSTSDLSSGAHWLPWQCMDLAFIHSLLKDGYGLPDDREVVLARSIRGMGVSWAQGLSYALVNEYHAQRALEDVDDAKPTVIPSDDLRINTTGVEIVDSLLTVIHQTTTDVLQYFNLVS